MGDFLPKRTGEAGEPDGFLAELDALFAERAQAPAAEVARYLNISMQKLMRLSDAGRIRFELKGYGWRFYSRYDVERFLMIDGYPPPPADIPVTPVTVAPARPMRAGNVIDLATARARLRA
jgi:hypothetical protein